jgi:general secretion pathway protein F
MPIFKYRGYAQDGAEVHGAVEAAGLHDAIAQVKAQKILPAELVEATGRKRKKLFSKRDNTFLPNMTRQLSILISSGVPLMEALKSVADEYQGYDREMLMAIKEQLSGGASFYRVLQDYGQVFSDYYVHMVQAGEASGTLDTVLIKLADFLEHQGRVRGKIRSAMIYPILMMGVSIVVLSFLFTFVIPKIVRIFDDAKGALPFITVMLIVISNAFMKYWWAILGILAVAFWNARHYVRRNRETMDRLLLKLPGNILQSLYYARFARAMEVLLGAGLPVLTVLKLAAQSIGNRALESDVLAAGVKVAEGQALASSLQGFPPVFLQLVATGEKTGRLADTMKRAALSYEEEFSRKVDGAVSVFEPAMIIAMSLVVCFIVLAVLLPIFQLNQLVK